MTKAQATSRAATIILASSLDIEEALSLRHLARQCTAERKAMEELDSGFKSTAAGLDNLPLRTALLHWALDREGWEAGITELKDPIAHMLLFNAKMEKKEYKDALKIAEKAAKEAPTEINCVLAPVQAMLSLGLTAEATKVLESLRREFSDRGEFSYQEARCIELQGDYEKAMAVYQKAVDLAPNHYLAIFRLAYLADLHGDGETALKLYQRIGPGQANVFINATINMALIYEDQGNYEKAHSCCRTVLKVDPNNHRARLFLRNIDESTSMYYSPEEAKETERMEAVMRIPVSDFELSVRSRNCLNRMNIRILGDLVRKTEQEMLGYKNFGETSLSEIKDMLSSRGLRLGMLRENGSPRQDRPRRPGPAVVAAPAPTGLESLSIDELELSVRSRKCMDRLGVSTVADLCAYSENDLVAAKNFGRVSLNEIKQKLAERGLSLR
ncbi:MAG: tetratricopeptide repeat protein [Planctomycetes bacterium]|nr:tetratricopeptide repeat protein [Planctomycetota bacterium]